VKLFQAASSAHFDFRKYTNKASYSPNEIDFELLQEITQSYKIELSQLEPINSGMIAIVFKGTIKGTIDNQKVVIKMRRKNIQSRLERGYDQLIWLYKCVRAVFKSNKIVKSLETIVELREFMLEQCDFKQEIYAMKTMKRELSEIEHMPKSENIIIPHVYNREDESQFIVMEYLEGVDGFSVPEKDKEEYAYLLYTNAMIMSCLINIFHTDLHPGNLIFMKDYKIGIIDFGMWINMPDNVRKITRIALCDFNSKNNVNGFDFLKHYFEPPLNKDILTEEMSEFICKQCDKFCLDLINGSMNNETITGFTNLIYDKYPQQIFLSKHGLNIILSTAMVNSTVSQLLSGDKEKIGKILIKVIKHLVS